MKRVNLLFKCIFLLLPLTSHALESDKNKPLLLEADTAEFSNLSHVGTYTGNVTLTQGTTHLSAHQAVTYGNKTNQLNLAIARGLNGKQAHYYTTTDLNKPLLHAYADTIKYYPKKHLIRLIGHAKVQQGDDLFEAPIIVYDTLKQHVVSQATKQGRTTITVKPTPKTA